MTFFIILSATFLSKFGSIEERVNAQTPYLTKDHSTKSTVVKNKELILNITPPIKSSDTSYVYLTFDDGPTEHTKEILTILNKYGVKSTFFMLYGNIMKHSETVKAVSNQDHSVGCHGVTHKLADFYESVASPKKEMQTCSDAVKQITGQPTTLVRVPFGSFPYLTTAQKSQLELGQFILWDWNVDSNDWNSVSVDQMESHILTQVKRLHERGSIPVILFHDKAITVDALPRIIESLQNLGYEFRAITTFDKPLQFKLKE